MRVINDIFLSVLSRNHFFQQAINTLHKYFGSENTLAENSKRLFRLVIISICLLLFNCGSSAKLTERGFKKLEKEEYPKANELFRKALEKNKNNSNAYYGLGKLAYEKKEYINAISLFDESINQGNEKAIKDRGFSYYSIALKEYSNNHFKKSLISINKSLDDFPSLEIALKLRAKILLENIKIDLTDNLPQRVISNYNLLIEQNDEFLIHINEEIKNLEPRVRLFVAKYNLSKGKDVLALKDVDIVLNSNTIHMNRYKKEALQMKSNIYEYRAKSEFRKGYFKKALKNINDAIAYFTRKELKYYRATINNELAKIEFKQSNLNQALELINSSIEEGRYSDRRNYYKLRAQIFFALAVNETDLSNQIDLCEKALNDDNSNKEMGAQIYNLYLSKVAELIDKEAYIRAQVIFKKATNIDDSHISTYNLFSNSLKDNDFDIYFDASIAEIYAINLRYEEAIEKIIKYQYYENRYIPHLNYNLARYYALNNQKSEAYAILSKYFSESRFRNYYSYFRKKAMDDPSFISLNETDFFYNWLNGINRIKLSLNYIQNIPKLDTYSESDSFLQVSQSSRLLLTTLKAQDQSNVRWKKGLYRVVFDYNFYEPLIFNLADSDFSTDDPIFYGSYNEFYPGNWDVILNKKTSSILNIDIEDCYNCPSEYSTHTYLPPKNSFFASLEDPSIRQNLSSISTIYVPQLAEDYGKVYQSYYFVSGLISSLAPCFGTYSVAISKKGFVTKQIFYWLIQSFNDIDYQKFSFEAFLEYMLNKVGNNFLINANNFRIFCDCAYNSIKS